MRYRPPYIGCMVTCCKLVSLPVNIQFSKNFPEEVRSQKSGARIGSEPLTADFSVLLVGLGRIELPTSPLSGVRSSQLSYRPVVSFNANVVELVGIEPATS
jgi:hypothetical protein